MADQDKNKENETKEPENKRKPHERHIVGRANFNNLDLSSFAKHDWKPLHDVHVKLAQAARARKAAERGLHNAPATMTVRVYFQKLDRVGDEEGELLPANDPAFDADPPVAAPIVIINDLNYVDIVVPVAKIATFSAYDLVEALKTYPPLDPLGQSTIFTDITYKHKNTIPPPWYVENIDINGDDYPTTPDEDGYTPYPEQEDALTEWAGDSWMFFDLPLGWNVGGNNTYVPYWDPDDNEDWDPADPDGLDGYPNETLDLYAPLWQLLKYNTSNGRYEIMFSFETVCFDFIYEPRDINGETKWVMVIRAMRRKKKK
jgi:hypothetical protein